MTTSTHTYSALQQVFEGTTLFAEKTWKLSPEPIALTQRQVDELARIGQACVEFHRALEVLYTRSWQAKNLARNGQLIAPWVAGYLDRGKPSGLVEHARHSSLKGALPSVLRPDLLLTEDGFALAELDAVPGGVGLTAFLNRLYGEGPFELVGDAESMITGFYDALTALVPDNDDPLIAIVVSDEASTYLPEFEWLAEQLRHRACRVHCFHPSEIMPLGSTLCAPIDGNPVKVDLIYRFFELFDLENVATAAQIQRAAENGEVVVSPPMRHFQEEKLNLALLHHHMLEDFWRENLSRGAFKLLRKIVPRSWVVDPVELPPNAVLDSPWVGGKPIREWARLGEATQKDRNLILKASGFHETAWGARSVVLGSDSSREEWTDALKKAVSMSDEVLHILQDYRKPMRVPHPVYREDGSVHPTEGRLRLCPYYFVQDGTSRLHGILATYCPPDKKIIHGMRDAAMLPVQVRD
ncbi:MAG: hypothetical protein ACFB20_06630 [Opitutales bacterium]